MLPPRAHRIPKQGAVSHLRCLAGSLHTVVIVRDLHVIGRDLRIGFRQTAGMKAPNLVGCEAYSSLLRFCGCQICGSTIRRGLPFVVLKGEPQLLDGPITSLDRGNAMATEVVTRVLHVRLGALECGDGFPYLRMGFAPFASGRGLRGNCALRDDRALNHGGGWCKSG